MGFPKEKPVWKTVRRFLKTLRIELPNDPAILLLSLYPRILKTFIRKDIRTPCSLQHYSRKLAIRKPCKTTAEWIKTRRIRIMGAEKGKFAIRDHVDEPEDTTPREMRRTQDKCVIPLI